MNETRSVDPAVSVLVTVYNRERFISECLTSVLASTFRDFELIVVDDASIDSSPRIASDFVQQDSRVRFFQNERNLGDYGNRARAASLAVGRYLKYVDSDDVIYPHSLGLMVQAMAVNPEAALGISHSAPEGEHPYPWKLEPHLAWRKEFLGDGCLTSGPSGAIFRRDAFHELGGFRDWGVLNDADLWYRMAARWPVVLLPPGLVWWRRHEMQEFSRDDAAMVYLEKGFQLRLDALASVNTPLSAGERDMAVKRARQHYARRLLSLASRGRRPIIAAKLLRRSPLSLADMVSGLSRYR